jgi:hypothetical protein
MNKTLAFAVVIIFVVVVGFTLLHTSPPSTLSQSDATQAVLAVHPELAAYQTTSLPPSSIETQQAQDGWYVAFIQRGSGLPGILTAQCYHVSNAKNVTFVNQFSKDGNAVVESIDFATCAPTYAEEPSATTTSDTPSPAPTPTSAGTVQAYGNVTLKLGQTATFKDISIKPLSIEEDSRCPSDVQCIQAGTVRVKVEVSAGMGTSSSILKLDQAFTTEGEAITLTSVLPGKNSKVTITPADYRLTFHVVKQTSATTPPPPSATGKCYVGGCSQQLCTDQPDMVSTCEYTTAYACYKTAICARQASGQCGWTQTADLQACLANAKDSSAQIPQ